MCLICVTIYRKLFFSEFTELNESVDGVNSTESLMKCRLTFSSITLMNTIIVLTMRKRLSRAKSCREIFRAQQSAYHGIPQAKTDFTSSATNHSRKYDLRLVNRWLITSNDSVRCKRDERNCAMLPTSDFHPFGKNDWVAFDEKPIVWVMGSTGMVSDRRLNGCH